MNNAERNEGSTFEVFSTVTWTKVHITCTQCLKWGKKHIVNYQS